MVPVAAAPPPRRRRDFLYQAVPGEPATNATQVSLLRAGESQERRGAWAAKRRGWNLEMGGAREPCPPAVAVSSSTRTGSVPRVWLAVSGAFGLRYSVFGEEWFSGAPG